MKYFAAAFVLLTAFSAESWASTVNAQAFSSSGFSYAADPTTANTRAGISGNPTLKAAVTAGDDLLIGTTVLVGSFVGLTDSDITSHSTDLAYLQQNFTLFGTEHIGDGGTPNGYTSGSVTNNSTTAITLAGQQIYFFVVASTTYAATETSSSAFANAFQIGIYYFDKAKNGNWAFPAQVPVSGSTVIDISTLTVGGQGTALESTANGAHVLVGGFGPDKSNTLTSKTNFTLASVPEPTTGAALLGTLGMALLFRRRRS